MSYDYLLTLCIILLSTKVLGLVSGRLHLPQVVGALMAGLVLGPAVLGVLAPSDLLNQLAELGVIVIMFSAGMETDIKELLASGKSGFLVALMGVIMPLVMGMGLLLVFRPDAPLLQAIFLGVVLTATSVSITVETLKELGKMSTKVGNTILAAALIDDVLGLICLTLVTSLGGAGVSIVGVLVKILLFFLFAGVVGFGFHWAMGWYGWEIRDKGLHVFPVISLVLCLLMAWSAEALFGVSDIIGAFAAGLMVASTDKAAYVANKCTPLSYLILTPVFFANIGLKVSLPQMSGSLVAFTAALIGVGILSKVVGCGLGAKLCGYPMRQCIQTGVGMACRGEVALIVANKGVSMGLIDPSEFSSVILMVIFFAVATPILLKMTFQGESPYEGLEESALVDNYAIGERVDLIANQLIQAEQNLHKK